MARPAFRPGRRAFIVGGLAMAAGLPLRAQAASPRLAAIDWAMMETALAIGQTPVAGCELIRFRAETVEPVVPPEVVDLGLRGAPNFELLQLMRPDLILSSPYYTRHEARLRDIAPVFSLPFFTPGEAPLPKVMAALEAVSARTGAGDRGQILRRQAEAELDRIAKALASFRDRPVALVDIGDARHLRAFGYDSLFGSILARLGLQNAWEGRSAFSFLAPIPIERLAEMPQARLVIVGDIPVEARQSLSRSILWQALPAVAEGRVYQLPRVSAFGGIPAALRFATLLQETFTSGPEQV